MADFSMTILALPVVMVGPPPEERSGIRLEVGEETGRVTLRPLAAMGGGPWGGGGRCGNQVGRDGTRFGAGGGGSYSAAVDGTPTTAGAGFSGCVMYRFLP